MKEHEGVYRFARFLRQLIIGTAVFVAVVAVCGYLFFVRRVNTQEAWLVATRELRGSILHYGEIPARVAHVYRRRPTNYYSAAAGVLAATPERLLYVGIEPKNSLAGEDAPPAILTSEFPNDTLLRLTPTRVYAFTAHGVIISRGRRREEYAATRGDSWELDSLITYIDRVQLAQRRAVTAERYLRAQVAEMLRRPLWYEIRRGDALSTIAVRFGTTVEQLRAWNHLTGTKVRIRDTLLVKPPG